MRVPNARGRGVPRSDGLADLAPTQRTIRVKLRSPAGAATLPVIVRALQLAIVILLSAFGLLAASGCGDECSRAADCTSEQVCLVGVCTAAQATYLSCSSNADCAGDSSVLVCRGGRCTFPSSGLAPDFGPPTPDTGMSMVDSGMGMADTGTTTDAGP